MLKELKKSEHKNEFFWNENKNETRRTLRAKEIHKAYRGGKVQAYQTGTINNVTYIDCNSLYPYIASTMRFPKLSSERKIEQPDIKEYLLLLNKIGLSKVVMKNIDNEHGLLPIRTNTSSHYPKPGTTFVGTYTHEELRLAIQEGYEITAVEWSITYDDMPNILTKPLQEMYKNRTQSNTELEKYLWKMLMNASFGKLGQTRTGQELFIDTIEKAQQYLKQNIQMIKGISNTTDILYKKIKSEDKKPYYTPIIPTLINAGARCYMYKQLKKIPIKDLVYTDTDSIIFTGDHLHKYNLTTRLGDFKIEHLNQTILIYGKKTYMINKEIKVAGIKKTQADTHNFKKGKITNKKMNTIHTTNNHQKIGTFTNEQRNLKTQLKEHKEHEKLMNSQKLLIDHDITNINYFLKTKSLNT